MRVLLPEVVRPFPALTSEAELGPTGGTGVGDKGNGERSGGGVGLISALVCDISLVVCVWEAEEDAEVEDGDELEDPGGRPAHI